MIAAKRRKKRKKEAKCSCFVAKDPVFVPFLAGRETSLALHSYLRHGHLEKVYELEIKKICIFPKLILRFLRLFAAIFFCFFPSAVADLAKGGCALRSFYDG
ncbi:MAG: hypothetical protein HY343_09610 [Lentisphaerae bacterium]|nr:hypothetical protein [Lentisphaerota bacterium]